MNKQLPSLELQHKFLSKLYTRSDIFEHLSILAQISSKVDSITEFGVRKIVSTWAFLYGCPKNMISIDLVNPSTHGENIEEVYKIAKENGINYEFIQGDTRLIDIKETDVLFIDTYHEYNQLKNELFRHGNKAKKYIILHDTELFGIYGQDSETDALNTNLKGLNYAIDEFLVNNPAWSIKFKYPFSSGLTILEKS